jgi:hypothetical protein
MVTMSERIGEVYRLVHTEEIVLGRDAYRLEVLQCVRSDTHFHEEPYSVRAYKRMEIEVQPLGPPRQRPMTATVWAHFYLKTTRSYPLEDQALAEAHAALLEEATRPRGSTLAA